MGKLDSKLPGFYAVLDCNDEGLARALMGPGGARILQVRIKPASAAVIWSAAVMARRICDEFGALLIVNDRIDIARAAGADGVHLGQSDVPLAQARKLAGDLVIGISTHTLDQVAQAVTGGADYVGFGPIFATSTKQNPEPEQGLVGLCAAVRAAGTTPVVAIGGVTTAHVSELYRAGAAAVCAIAAVNRASDVARAARAMRP